jgi:MFS family permease
MFGTILFIQLFIQGVIGTNATQSGTVLMPMMFVMIGSSIISGQVISRTGRYKLVGLFGMTMMAGGLLLLSGMGPETDYLTVLRNMIIVGVGIGPTMPVFTLAAQNAVNMSQLGVVTSLTQFARSIGSTVGVAVFGSLLTNRFGPAFQSALPDTVSTAIPPDRLAQFQNPQALLNPQAAEAIRQQAMALGPQGAQIYDALLGAIKIGLVTAIHDIFIVAAVLAALGGVATLFLEELPLRKTYGPVPEPASPSDTAAHIGQAALPSLPALKPEDDPEAHVHPPAATSTSRPVRSAVAEPAQPGSTDGATGRPATR